MKAVTITVPGKLILMGEHAAVYGRPALIAAVDLWMLVRVASRAEPGISIELPALDHTEVASWSSIHAYARRARERWKQYVDDGTTASFAAVRSDDPAHLVKVALGETARFLEEDEGPAFTLRIESEQPVGVGFGSSAAVAVGVVQAYLTLRGVSVGDAQLHQLALEVERRQHGMPSGIDPATVLRGGGLWAERDTSGHLQFESIDCRTPLLDRIRVFDTGTPAESTGEVVAAVREVRDQDPERFNLLLDRMERATRRLRALVTCGDERPEDTVAAIREYEACLEELGAVPEAVHCRVRAIEERGGAAKISGAGALTGPGAGSLLVYHPQTDVDLRDALGGLPRHFVRLGAEGAHREDDL